MSYTWEFLKSGENSIVLGTNEECQAAPLMGCGAMSSVCCQGAYIYNSNPIYSYYKQTDKHRQLEFALKN